MTKCWESSGRAAPPSLWGNFIWYIMSNNIRHASSTGVLESFKHCLTMSQHCLLAAATHIVNTDVAQDRLMLCCSEFKENKQELMSDMCQNLNFFWALNYFLHPGGSPFRPWEPYVPVFPPYGLQGAAVPWRAPSNSQQHTLPHLIMPTLWPPIQTTSLCVKRLFKCI